MPPLASPSSTSSRARALGVGLLALALPFVACTRAAGTAEPAAATPPRGSAAAPSASAAPPPSPSASAPAPASPAASVAIVPAPPDLPASFAAWTDPAGLAALVADCHHKEEHPPRDDEDRSALSCTLPWQQACVYDPCFTRLQECRGACGKTCGACDERCATTCDDCKGRCKGEACLAACAKTTATCKQACLGAVDRCGTGQCAARMKPCYADEKRKWVSHGCSWEKVSGCANACIDRLNECQGPACDDVMPKCRDACSAKYPGCDVSYAIMGSDPSRTEP